jgi:hypothetical protein
MEMYLKLVVNESNHVRHKLKNSFVSLTYEHGKHINRSGKRIAKYLLHLVIGGNNLIIVNTRRI